MSVHVIGGDCQIILPTLDAESFDCCVTSPPYWGLRDYGVDGQIGLEPTLDAYVETMVGVFRKVRRVLKSSGTAWLNLGDSYAGANNGYSGDSRPSNANSLSRGSEGQRASGQRNKLSAGLFKNKDLCGVPWRVAFALQADGWWLRSAIVWHKPNPMPESVTDRPTSAYEMVFLLTKSERYFYDADAIAEEVSEWSRAALAGRWQRRTDYGTVEVNGRNAAGDNYADRVREDGKRNARNVWTIATQPYRGSHFATMPPDLAERCIKAGCPKSGHVLDPFGGAGTTGLVADRLGRDATLIELNPQYTEMQKDRIEADAPLFAEVVQ